MLPLLLLSELNTAKKYNISEELLRILIPTLGHNVGPMQVFVEDKYNEL